MTEPREPLPVKSEDLPRIVAGLQAQAQMQLDEKRVKALAEINTKAFDRSTAYANVVLVAGYAGGFTIWSFTRAQIPAKAGIAIALALLVSLAAFIVFEVVKMTVTGEIVMKRAASLQRAQEPAQILREIEAIEGAQAGTLLRLRWYWVVTMVISVGGALIALCLLAYNFVAVLLGLPGWPS